MSAFDAVVLLLTSPCLAEPSPEMEPVASSGAASRCRSSSDDGGSIFIVADPEAPHLRVQDLGATRGDGIFETLSVCGGRVQALEAHLTRFANSARLLDLPEPDLDDYRSAILAAVARHVPVAELWVKTVLTRGVEGAGGAQGVPTGWVLAEAVGDLSAVRTQGIRVVTLDRGYRHDVAETSPWLLQGAKTLSYALNRSVLREAERRGADDVIFVSSDGFVLEGPTSNVIARFGTLLVTPSTDQGILAGTTQADVFSYAESIGMKTEFALMPFADLADADALWLVSSVRHAAPVNALNGRALLVDVELSREINDFLIARTE